MVFLPLPLSLDRILFQEITTNVIQTCSVTEQRCHDKMRDYVIPQLQQSTSIVDIISLHDGKPPHINRLVNQFLRQDFTAAQVISRHFQYHGLFVHRT